MTRKTNSAFLQKYSIPMMINEVNMKKFLFIVALLVQQIDVLAVTVETTVNLNVYYPEYTKIDLICGQMPKAAQKDVEFCCEAAFTGKLLNEFKHTNIADNHICNGEMKKGYRCKANTGGFVWGNPTEANGWNMGFCQLLIIKDSAVRPIGTKMKNNRTIYRALCEKDGKLCIIESKKVMTYEFFVKCLSAYKVTHALYLDMGRGWNYAWYREKGGKVKDNFP